MLKKGDIVKLNYNQSLVMGKVDEVGENMCYVLIVDPVFMIPIKSEGGLVDFKLQRDKNPIYFVGSGYFAAVLDINDELYKKYIQVTSGLIVMPGGKSSQ